MMVGLRGKKGAERLWWILGIAFVVLVTIALLIGITYRGIGSGEKGLLGCLSKGGKCKTLDECSELGGTISETFQCDKKNGEEQYCCFVEKIV